jgi:hypothetical protein
MMALLPRARRSKISEFARGESGGRSVFGGETRECVDDGVTVWGESIALANA